MPLCCCTDGDNCHAFSNVRSGIVKMLVSPMLPAHSAGMQGAQLMKIWSLQLLYPSLPSLSIPCMVSVCILWIRMSDSQERVSPGINDHGAGLVWHRICPTCALDCAEYGLTVHKLSNLYPFSALCIWWRFLCTHSQSNLWSCCAGHCGQCAPE